MKVTVLTVTARDIGLLESQAEWLDAQTLDEMEWVIIDDLYAQRKETVASLKTRFPIMHRPPNVIKEGSAFASACNSGIQDARGNLVYFMNDYVEIGPNVLERHWEIFRQWGPSVLISGQFKALPGMKQYVNRSADRAVDAYLAESMANNQEDSIFKHGEDQKWMVAYHRHWSAGVNDSAPLKLLLKANGFDERLDGEHGGQDDELGMRMVMMGSRFLLDSKEPCYEHAHGPSKPKTGRETRWEDLFAQAYNGGPVYAPNDFDLATRNEECTKQWEKA